MSIKITELPNLTSSSLTGVSSAVLPIVANTGSGNTTYQTTIGNVKTFVEAGNLNITGAINAGSTSTLANLIITGNLNVQGTTTTTSSQNLSTNSSIIDLHTFNSNLAPWTSDDGRDIGLRFFWYKNGIASASALVWENGTQYLTWYGDGVSNANTGAISGTLGTIQAGQVILSNTTPATANATGALQVSGGISTGGNIYATSGIYAGGVINAVGQGSFASLISNATGSIGSTLSVGGATTVQSLTSNSYATVQTTLVTGGNATLNGLTVNNSTTVGGTLGVTGAATINGTATVNGALTSAGGLQNTPIGNATASTATFTTIQTGNVIPTAANTYSLGSSSLWYSNVYATAIQSNYADLAEKYEADVNYEPGTVVIFGGEKEITSTNTFADTRVAGVISTDPAYLMNGHSTGLPVALRGKVPVKVIGQVSKGDLLVTSNEPEYAVSVGFRTDYNPAAVVAKSLVEDRNFEKRVIWAVII